MVASLGGGGAGAGYFANAFDDLIEEFGNYLNAAGDNMHWMAGANRAVECRLSCCDLDCDCRNWLWFYCRSR